MELKSTEYYLKKYKTHIIVLLAIITTNLSWVTKFSFENFSFWLVLLLPILGILASCLFAGVLFISVALFESYIDKSKDGVFERNTHFTRYLLITSIVNIIMYIANKTTILDLINN